MSFDALTIAGALSALLAGGFLIALVRRNDSAESSGRVAPGIDNKR
jgi:hypothetical protein